MCGIFGIVTKKTQVLGPILIEAGHKLSYRGYDTVGAATLPAQGAIDLRKDVGRVSEVAEKYGFAEMHGNRAGGAGMAGRSGAGTGRFRAGGGRGGGHGADGPDRRRDRARGPVPGGVLVVAAEAAGKGLARP